MKKLLLGIVCSALMSHAAFAVDLMTAYQHASDSDPIFKQALADYQAATENVPKARSALLPQLNFDGSGTLSEQDYNRQSAADTTARGLGFQVSLSQSIFNFSSWKALSAANYSVKAAAAVYNAAAQSLIERTAVAYFNILQAEEILKYNAANKKAIYQEYQQAKASFDVGLKTITDVYDAKAAYDKAVAQYVIAKNNLDNAKENLRTITGRYYSSFAPLKETLPLVIPNPKSIDQWVQVASKQNWELIAARYGVLASKENLKKERAGHLPTLGFSASYQNQGVHTMNGASKGFSRTETKSAALNLDMPIFSGGLTSAKTREALAKYRSSYQQREIAARSMVNNTRQAYLAITAGIKTVQADLQAIKSNRSALTGTKESYKVGTRTMVDVLQAQSALFNSLQQYAQDRYNYVISLFTLKQAAGTLSAEDIRDLNRWLIPNLPQQKKAKQQPKKTQKSTLPSTAKGIYLQAGAFKNHANALDLQNDLKKITKTPVVVVKQKELYKVKIGPIATKNSANLIAQTITKTGVAQPIVVN